MAGLLDFLSTPEGRLGMGLLAAAGPSERPLSFGQRLQMGMQTADDSNNQLMRQKLMQSQVDENTSQAEIRKAAVERARRIQELVSGATANGGPIDYQSLARQGVPFEMLKNIAEAPNLGRQKVARTMKGIGPDNKEYEYQVDDFGNRIGEGTPQWKAPIQVDLGGSVDFRDAYNLGTVSSLPKTMTKEGEDASKRGWANVGIAREKLAFDKTGGVDAVKPPKQGPMSVTLQKELLESDDAVQSGKAIVGMLEQAKKINKTAYSGYGAKPRAVLASNLPGATPGADATIDLDNMMTGQALESLKTVFGGMPTEGERKILLEMQASADKTPAQREAIMDRAITAAKRRASYAEQKAKAIRSGSYLTDGVPAPVDGADATKPQPKVATLADIAETARKSGKSTAEVTKRMKELGYTIGGQ